MFSLSLASSPELPLPARTEAIVSQGSHADGAGPLDAGTAVSPIVMGVLAIALFGMFCEELRAWVNRMRFGRKGTAKMGEEVLS